MTRPKFSLSMEMGAWDPPEAIDDNKRGGFALEHAFSESLPWHT
jgi:hypothetical protein